MEIPDVLVVTKADLGRVATRALADLRAALRSLGRADDRGPGRVLGARRRPGSTSSSTRWTPTGRARPRRAADAQPPRCTRWPTSPPSTATAACGRSAAGARPSAGWARRTRRSTWPRCCARSSSGPAMRRGARPARPAAGARPRRIVLPGEPLVDGRDGAAAVARRRRRGARARLPGPGDRRAGRACPRPTARPTPAPTARALRRGLRRAERAVRDRRRRPTASCSARSR